MLAPVPLSSANIRVCIDFEVTSMPLVEDTEAIVSRAKRGFSETTILNLPQT